MADAVGSVNICPSCEARFAGADWCCPACGHDPALNGYRVLAAPVPEFEHAFDSDLLLRMRLAEEKSFWSQARSRLIVWSIAEYFPDAQSFLEVGCGIGIVLRAARREFPHLRIAGGEIHTASLELAAARTGGVDLFQFDGRRIPFEEEFDLVGCFDVLEQVRDDELVLAQMFSALRPGGGLILSLPQHPRLWSAADVWDQHVRRYTKGETMRKVVAAGFEILRVTSFVFFLLPLMAISRLRARNLDRYDPLGELELAPWLQAPLAAVLRLELGLIKAGVSLPAGGSLVVIARRPVSGTSWSS